MLLFWMNFIARRDAAAEGKPAASHRDRRTRPASLGGAGNRCRRRLKSNPSIRHDFIAPFIPFLIVIALLAFLSFRAATWKRRIAYADHYHWIFRSLVALVAVSALIATAIGTWRGSGIDKGFHPAYATIPTLPQQPLLEIKNGRTVNLGSAKLIGTVIVARWENGLLIPVAGKSGVCDLRSTQPWRLAIHGSWQSSHYEVVTDINRFVQQGANLQPEGSLTIKTHGPGWSSNRVADRP